MGKKNKNNIKQVNLKGIPSSGGISIGKAAVIKPDTVVSPDEHIDADKVSEEIVRFDTSVRELIKEFLTVLDRVKKEAGNVAAILETNLLMLTDTYLNDAIQRRIKNCFSAESSIIQEFDEQKHFLINSRDSLLRERAIELDQLKERMLGALKNQSMFYDVPEGSIVVAQSLSPSDIIHFKETGISGIITEIGGITSHSSILARTYDIPEVIGVKTVTDLIKNGTPIIVDGFSGAVIIKPNQSTVLEYVKKISEIAAHKKKLGTLHKVKSVTLDGIRIHLMSNIDSIDDINQTVISGGEGIGLLRSEYMILSTKHLPGEDEQFDWYNEIAARIYPNPVTIRVFDIGSDKFSEGLPRHEDNPALGFRGIRFLLSRKDIFKSQIRAILRASKNKNLRIMLPMITRHSEIILSKHIIEECKQELYDKHIAFDRNIPVGVMIETPAAAIVSEAIAGDVDFFSIGTNDLTQYTLAADRGNELVSDIFDSFHPAVIRLISYTVKAAKKYKIRVGVCGELAGHAASTALLIGLGIEELSVAPSILLETKSRILELNSSHSKELAEKALICPTVEEIHRLIEG